MKRVIFLIGIPGSGKSTWAKEYVNNNPNTVILSRDSFRRMISSNYKITYKHESLITDWMLSCFEIALNAGKDIIIDNTNLKFSYIDSFIDIILNNHTLDNSYFSTPYNIYFKVFDTPLNVCLERNGDGKNARPETERVPFDVIKNMYNQFLCVKISLNDYLNVVGGHLLD